MDAKSVMTSPSPQCPITHGSGPLVIPGLAWSGRGAITRVDVSKDGGMTWETARLGKPGEQMALTRFYLDTDGTASRCSCSRVPWTKPDMSNRPKPSCATCAAEFRSTTTIAFKLGL